MVASLDAGAPSYGKEGWHQIDWYQAQRTVRRLQARIVKATQEGRWGKVKALQRLLTHSFGGKALAIKRVTENQGKKTPGVDGVTWDTPEKKMAAIHTLKQRGYNPKPLRRVYIPKSNGKKRPLGIPTMHDRAMQALYLLALDPVSETTADLHSYGFRPSRSTADAIDQCFRTLGKKHSAQWVLEGDIKACFDRINHEWILDNIPLDKTILRKWLKAGYMENNILHPTDEGTPQGGIISPVLANMVLDGLERAIREKFPKYSKGTHKGKVNMVRYADDFVITGETKELLENEVMPIVKQFMKERGLELSPEKTVITHLDEGFDFLGQNLRKYKGKLIITPSKKNVRNHLNKIREVVASNRTARTGTLIWQLNAILYGWALYHRHVCSSGTYSDVSNAVFEIMWKWARRRHPHKGAKWIKRRYICSFGNRNWVFFGYVAGPKGTTRKVHLYETYNMTIKRHVPVREGTNPYDPEWEIYFEERQGLKMANDLQGRKKLLHLWREQNGLCPICHTRITKITGWEDHHIIWKSKGGDDKLENQVLVHPDCHKRIHSLGLEVVKPRPGKGV